MTTPLSHPSNIPSNPIYHTASMAAYSLPTASAPAGLAGVPSSLSSLNSGPSQGPSSATSNPSTPVADENTPDASPLLVQAPSREPPVEEKANGQIAKTAKAALEQVRSTASDLITKAFLQRLPSNARAALKRYHKITITSDIVIRMHGGGTETYHRVKEGLIPALLRKIAEGNKDESQSIAIEIADSLIATTPHLIMNYNVIASCPGLSHTIDDYIPRLVD